MVNKILSLILSLATAGGPAAGTVIGTLAAQAVKNIDLPSFPTQAIVQRLHQ